MQGSDFTIAAKPTHPASSPDRELTIDGVIPTDKNFELQIVNWVHPQTNQSCMGLYQAGDLYCTQMEAEGMRKFLKK